METQNYLMADQFYWYNKTKKMENKKEEVEETYVFTSNYFTFGPYLKPNNSCYHSEANRDKVFGETHSVYKTYSEEVKFSEIPEPLLTFMDKAIEQTKDFFSKVNNKEVEPLETLHFRYGQFSILVDKLTDELIFINADEYLVPMQNLLENLMSCCCLDENDTLCLFYNPELQIVYIAWWEEASKRYYWCAGIKPVHITKKAFGKAFNERLANLNSVANKNFKDFSAKNDEVQA